MNTGTTNAKAHAVHMVPRVIIKNQPPGYRFHTEHYDSRQIIHVLEGTLFVREKTSLRFLEAGQTLVLPPGSAFTLFCKRTGYSGIGVLCSGAKPGEMKKCVIMEHDKILSMSFRQVWEEVKASSTKFELMAAAVNFIEKAVYTRITPESQPRTLEQWLDYAKDILSSAVHEKYDLMERLSSIPVSYEYLSRAFKKREGVTLKKFALEMKLQEAERLLLENKLSITEIAYELGFASSQHFAVCFKTGRKIPPSVWARKQPPTLSR